MENVAVIDMGSARTKVAILQEAGNNILKLKHETALSEHINKEQELDVGFVNNVVLPKLSEFIIKAKENNCTRILTIGTHVFRTIGNSNEIKQLIENEVGNLNILEGWLEGSIFFSWMKELRQTDNLFVIDIGGGSVQIATDTNKDNILSFHTGTSFLARKFQKSKEKATESELIEIQNFIKSNLKGKMIKSEVDVAIMGSNCMKEFIASALNRMKDKGLRDTLSDGKEISLTEATTLFEEIKCKDYSSLEEYYPQNKVFMYGADKALINLIEICKFYGVSRIQPTNESVSSALLSLLLRFPEKLEELGLIYQKL